jgi:hypothetical protein
MQTESIEQKIRKIQDLFLDPIDIRLETYTEIDKNGTKSQLLSIQFPGTIVNVKFNFDDRNKYLMEGEENNIDFNDLL